HPERPGPHHGPFGKTPERVRVPGPSYATASGAEWAQRLAAKWPSSRVWRAEATCRTARTLFSGPARVAGRYGLPVSTSSQQKPRTPGSASAPNLSAATENEP